MAATPVHADRLGSFDHGELLEGVSLDRCGLSLEGECPSRASCRIQSKLRGIEEECLKSLERLSIAELASDISIKKPKATSK